MLGPVLCLLYIAYLLAALSSITAIYTDDIDVLMNHDSHIEAFLTGKFSLYLEIAKKIKNQN